MTNCKEPAPKPTGHALLGASSAYRWLNCPPSARLCEALPDTESPYAREGTLAHELAALRLEQSFDPKLTKRSYTAACNKLLKDPEAGSDMAGAVGQYVDLVKDTASGYAQRPFIAIEQRVDYSHIVPEGFGTCDCLMIGLKDGDGEARSDAQPLLDRKAIATASEGRGGPLPQASGAQVGSTQSTDGPKGPDVQPLWQLRVMDYKHGKGVPVSAEHNPQLMLYALGALRLFAPVYPIGEVALVICQPRLDNVTEWITTPEALTAWGESIRPTARMAWEGGGEQKEGEWCRFCKLGATCRARARAFTALDDFGTPTPAALTDSELGGVLAIGVRLERWLAQVKDYAQALLLGGGELPGWKLVEGRSVRAFIDREEAFAKARAQGVDENLLYVREPITLTALESLMGKKQFAVAMEGQIVRKPGKPTLAPENDPRPALAAATAAEDFGI